MRAWMSARVRHFLHEPPDRLDGARGRQEVAPLTVAAGVAEPLCWQYELVVSDVLHRESLDRTVPGPSTDSAGRTAASLANAKAEPRVRERGAAGQSAHVHVRGRESFDIRRVSRIAPGHRAGLAGHPASAPPGKVPVCRWSARKKFRFRDSVRRRQWPYDRLDRPTADGRRARCQAQW
jgi:hypothetical protein